MSTFRADTRAGAYQLLVAFAAANPTWNLSPYAVRPSAFGNRPLCYVGNLNETIEHTGYSLYRRTLSPQFVFVWASSADRTLLADVRDDVVDAFITYAMANVHAISNQTVTTPSSVEDVELELDGAFYPASIVTNGDTLALEGSA